MKNEYRTMKKIILTIVFLFSLIFAFGQVKLKINLPEKHTIPKENAVTLVGKWQLDSIQSGTLQKNTDPRTIEFLKNNKYKEVVLKDQTKGKWKVANDTLTLIPNKSKHSSGASTAFIEKLTSQKLVYSKFENGTKMFLYFVKVE